MKNIESSQKERKGNKDVQNIGVKTFNLTLD